MHVEATVVVRRVRNPACTATSTFGKERYINGQEEVPLKLCIRRCINGVHLHNIMFSLDNHYIANDIFQWCVQTSVFKLLLTNVIVVVLVVLRFLIRLVWVVIRILRRLMNRRSSGWVKVLDNDPSSMDVSRERNDKTQTSDCLNIFIWLLQEQT